MRGAWLVLAGTSFAARAPAALNEVQQEVEQLRQEVQVQASEIKQLQRGDSVAHWDLAPKFTDEDGSPTPPPTPPPTLQPTPSVGTMAYLRHLEEATDAVEKQSKKNEATADIQRVTIDDNGQRIRELNTRIDFLVKDEVQHDEKLSDIKYKRQALARMINATEQKLGKLKVGLTTVGHQTGDFTDGHPPAEGLICSRLDGSGLNAEYPCKCGTAVCTEPQFCHAAGSACSLDPSTGTFTEEAATATVASNPACDVTDLTGASSVYPCTCGTTTCRSDTAWCLQLRNKCYTVTEEESAYMASGGKDSPVGPPINQIGTQDEADMPAVATPFTNDTSLENPNRTNDTLLDIQLRDMKQTIQYAKHRTAVTAEVALKNQDALTANVEKVRALNDNVGDLKQVSLALGNRISEEERQVEDQERKVKAANVEIKRLKYSFRTMR